MTPTDLETLQGLLHSIELYKQEKTRSGGHASGVFNSQYAAISLSALNAELALTALLADYERLVEADKGAKHDIERLMDACNQYLNENERMREWVLREDIEHGYGCDKVIGEIDGYSIEENNECTCGLDALRATLKGEKHE